MADEPLRPDIQDAVKRMGSTMGSKREIRKLPEYLWQGEIVQHMASGNYGPGTGLIVLTDRRLLFVMDGWTRAATEDFPLDKISSVQWNSGMLMGTITVYASGNKAEIKNVANPAGKAISDTIRARLSAPPPAQAGYPTAQPVPPQHMAAYPQPPAQPAAPPAPASAASLVTTPEQIYAALEQLGRLRDAGVLTPEEFDAKKAELLARI